MKRKLFIVDTQEFWMRLYYHSYISIIAMDNAFNRTTIRSTQVVGHRHILSRKGINWWYTPASSPDLNPIENVWGSLKQYLRTVVKPRSIEELKAGIQEFWQTLTPVICQRYVAHLHKVIPKVIEEDGGPSMQSH